MAGVVSLHGVGARLLESDCPFFPPPPPLKLSVSGGMAAVSQSEPRGLCKVDRGQFKILVVRLRMLGEGSKSELGLVNGRRGGAAA